MRVTMKLSELHHLANIDARWWWTPGAAAPYWATQASFMYDVCVASPFDFLEGAGYDTFPENEDYSSYDEELEFDVERPEPLNQ